MTETTKAPSNQVEQLPYDERDEDYHEFEEYDEVTKPAARPFYKRRKYWIFCAIMTVIIVAVAVPIGLFVILPKVAQTILNGSTMSFDNIQITEPTNSTLQMSMAGTLGNTGPFSATIQFPEPIQVYYNEKLLGSMNLKETKASGGKGSISDSTTFNINDADAFGSFSADMVGFTPFCYFSSSIYAYTSNTHTQIYIYTHTHTYTHTFTYTRTLATYPCIHVSHLPSTLLTCQPQSFCDIIVNL